MSISIVQTATNAGSSTSGTTLTVTFSSSPIPGNLLFVCCGSGGSALTAPSGWTTIDNTSDTSSVYSGTFYRIVQSGDGTSYTFTRSGSPNYQSIVAWELSGVSTSSPINGHSITTVAPSTTSFSTTAVTPTVTGCFAISAFAQDENAGYVALTSVSSGWANTLNSAPREAYQNTLCASLTSLTTTLAPISNTFTTASNTSGIISLVVFAPNTTVPSGPWTGRKKITINHSMVSTVSGTNLTNFPVLISGTYSYLATTSNSGSVTSPNGFDVIFTSDSAGENPLNWEVDSYNGATGAVSYWVQVPTVSASLNSVFYMFYGNSAVTTDQSSKQATWDTNYMGVWHLGNGTTVSAADSTFNYGIGSLTNSPSAVSGVIGEAAQFSASSEQSISVPNSFSLNLTSQVTVSGWINPNSPNAWATSSPSLQMAVVSTGSTSTVQPESCSSISVALRPQPLPQFQMELGVTSRAPTTDRPLQST